MRRLAAIVFSVFLGFAAAGAHAAGWPDKPVHIIVPYPPGAADSACRVLAKKLSEYWSQPVIVENKPGAAGVFSGAAARPDGYTLLLAASSQIITAPLLNKRLPYDAQRDLTPVSQIVVNTPILIAHPSLGIKTIKELVAYAKSHPGSLNFSSSGIGTPNHLTMELFTMVTGTTMTHVPYKGGGPSVSDLLAGHVQLGVNATPSVLPQVKAGRLVPLAVVSTKRDRALPDVPTMTEAGVPGLDYSIWYGLFAPVKVPTPLVNRISADIARALAEPDVVQQIVALGSEPAPTSPQQFATAIQKERAVWSKVIKEKNLTLDE